MSVEPKDYFHKLRQKLVFHIHEVSRGTNQVTPRAFHQEVLINFQAGYHPLVTSLFFEMTEIYTNKWVYHRLKSQWIDYDKK